MKTEPKQFHKFLESEQLLILECLDNNNCISCYEYHDSNNKKSDCYCFRKKYGQLPCDYDKVKED